jgi:hypothetical protein
MTTVNIDIPLLIKAIEIKDQSWADAPKHALALAAFGYHSLAQRIEHIASLLDSARGEISAADAAMPPANGIVAMFEQPSSPELAAALARRQDYDQRWSELRTEANTIFEALWRTHFDGEVLRS